ncbi:MAG TPA: glycosyltransferase [Flavobacteriaceae bacterium]|nr:glycosyltransferase [Flavobacteriaceae bacterium]
MKVVHLTTSSRGGAGIAALRLHEALREVGVVSAFVSTDCTINFEGEKISDSFFEYRRTSFWKRLLRKISSAQKDRLQNRWEQLKPHLTYEIANLPFSRYAMEEHPLVQQANLVHLHWVGRLVDYPTFFQKLEKPLVWTLHDMNPFLGLFHYKTDLQRNPQAEELDMKIRTLKKEALQTIGKGTIVSPSQWLLNAAKESEVFQKFDAFYCIPNSLGITPWKAERQKVRERLNLTEDTHAILFTAGSLDNPRKGMDILLVALEKLTTPVTLLTLGKGTVSCFNTHVKVIPLGFIDSQEALAETYAAADVFVLPSREDNFPNTLLEALSVGTPVISFQTGGMCEVIEPGFNGDLIEEMNPEALAKAIERFFQNKQIMNRQAIRETAQQKFQYINQIAAYREAYQQLIT